MSVEKDPSEDDPLAFPCPRCGLRTAVTHVDGHVDIFHLKPECAAFLRRDLVYREEVLRADVAKRREEGWTYP